MKIVFSSQRREMLFLLTSNMAAVTSHANEQFILDIIRLNTGYNVDRYIHLRYFSFSV